jgi:glycosyltransferase involved in cell wall biosynthesis
MRIGLITGEFPPMQGGVGAFTERLAKSLCTLGHEVHVISRRQTRPQLEDGQRPGLGQLREPVKVSWGVLHPVARRWGWSDVARIAQIALRYELEVLDVQYQAAAYNMHSPAINLGPWRLKGLAATVVTFHDLRVPYLFPKAGPLRRYIVRLAAQKSHGVIVTNGADRRVVEGWLKDKGRVAEIPIGSNVQVHDAGKEVVAQARRDLRLADDAFLLGYFGFLNESKGADNLVQALASQPPNVHLVFIGGRTGSSDQKNNERFVASVEELAHSLRLAERVHWTGFLPDDRLSALMRAVDLMVLPYRDGVSLRRGTLMAALAHGRPIISTRPDGDVSAFAHGENIWLAGRDDVQALATAIDTLRQDEPLRNRLAHGARQLAATFSWESIARRTVAFFEALGA